jgi:hypothetical protein
MKHRTSRALFSKRLLTTKHVTTKHVTTRNSFTKKLKGDKYIAETVKSGKKYITKFWDINHNPITFIQGIDLLISCEEFRANCTFVLNKYKKPYYFKLRPINNKKDLVKQFKIETMATKLHSKQDPSQFYDKFTDKYSVSKYFYYFTSPSGNGMLVPKNASTGYNNTYVHFHNFMNNAPRLQIDDFWKTLAKIIKQQEYNVHVNTHGLSVPWLHVRLDIRPTKW